MTLNNGVKWDGGRRRGCAFQMCPVISPLTAECTRTGLTTGTPEPDSRTGFRTDPVPQHRVLLLLHLHLKDLQVDRAVALSTHHN
jgi:hypothetical protein